MKYCNISITKIQKNKKKEMDQYSSWYNSNYSFDLTQRQMELVF